MEFVFKNDGSIKKVFLIIPMFVLTLLIVLFSMAIFKSDSVNYIIVNETLILKGHGLNWNKVSEFNNKILDSNFTVYSSGKITNDVILSYNDGIFYYMNNQYEDLQLKNVEYACNYNCKIKFGNYDFDYLNDNDTSYLEDLLDVSDVSSFMNQSAKISYDFDSDGVVETVYTVTNASLEYTGEEQKSLLFVVKNNKVLQVLDNDYPNYFVRSVLDLDNDGKYELIVSKGDLDISTFDSCYQIYTLQHGKFERIMDCN